MKSAGSYISSFIASVLLIFALIGSVGCIAADSFLTQKRLTELTEEKEVSGLVYKELDKFFSEQYAVTGIPANIYMDALDDEYLQEIINEKIRFGFMRLGNSDYISPEFSNEKLDTSITDFYKEYAQSINYEIKNENDPYYAKLKSAKENAHKVILQYCDVYKFSSLDEHGVLRKVSPIYSNLTTMKIMCIGASAILALVLVVCNFKRTKDTLYWIGASALSAGVLGGVPCIYLINTDYFSAFTIKQSQIYTSYTSAMRTFTSSFLTACCILAASAVVLFILYGIFSALSRKSENKTSDVDTEHT
ncbi:MAG: hypothetical protein J6B75_00775 [Ruminococcus sp.]|nr:hypothetical protein [Ruminococcus sp.]